MVNERDTRGDSSSISQMLQSIRQAVEEEKPHAMSEEPKDSDSSEVLELRHPLDEDVVHELEEALQHTDKLGHSRFKDLLASASFDPEPEQVFSLKRDPEFERGNGCASFQEEKPSLTSIQTRESVEAAFARLHDAQHFAPASEETSDLEKAGEEALSKALSLSVKEMLKPLLKDWLDRHLPSIVQDMVEQEIKRLHSQNK